MARDKYGTAPLHSAARYGLPENIQSLLNAGAELMARNNYGTTPLHSAAFSGTPENVQALLAAGADAKAINKAGKTPWDLVQKNKKQKAPKPTGR